MIYPNLILVLAGVTLIAGALGSAPAALQVGHAQLAAYTAGVILIAWAPVVTLAASLRRQDRKP